jgi:hypothetical protein
MITRAFLAFAALIALGQTATAGVPLFGHVSCGVVRFYVAKYSQAAAEKWARGHGAGEAEIETARRCLHPANVQTATTAVRSKVLAPVSGYPMHTSWLRKSSKTDSLFMDGAEGGLMAEETGLGRFGDRRLEKGGPRCMRHWFGSRAHAFDALPETEPGRFSSRAFCATKE